MAARIAPGILSNNTPVRNSRVRPILLPENTIGGVGSAANAGLDAATGDFLGFVDGDDYLELDMFEKMCRTAVDDQSDLVLCQYLEFNEVTGESREPAERRAWADIGNTRILRLDAPGRVIQVLGFIAVPWRKIYARSLLEKNEIRFPVVDHAWEDNPFHWFTVCSAQSVSFVREVLCHHRLGRAGQSMVSRSPGFVKVFGHYETIRSWLSQRDVLPAYEGALLSWALAQYEWVVGRLPPEAGEALYEAVRPVVLSVDETVLDKALGLKLRSTGTMMRLARNEEKRQFVEQFQRRFDAETSASRAIGARLERGLAMLGLAKENLRVYGVRNTLTKILERFGLRTGTASSGEAVGSRAVTEEQLVKLLAVLQRDMDRKHGELVEKIGDLQRELKEGEKGQGDGRRGS